MAYHEISSRDSSFAEDAESQKLIQGADASFPESRRSLGSIITLSRIYSFTLHALLITLIAILFTQNRDRVDMAQTDGRTWSPVQKLVEYEINGKHANGHNRRSPFQAPPSKESDDAWLNLVEPMYFNATREEIERAGESMDDIVELVGGGYVGALGVYHELHCLRRLRFWLYQDHYYPNLTEVQREYEHGHLAHCIDSLRLTIMCHGNTGMVSFNWKDPKSIFPGTQSNSKSVCAKWSSIEDWSRSRMISINPPILRPARLQEGSAPAGVAFSG
ncbi:hypothetical protein PT974_12550 [Cladobotryum mycophilum]|uniref:Tat pathway signal sequence protein n=1 Tax=Cladobotryum mycophilum TaxID=491253 RepID=A0ABR0S984_9HYPO